MANETNQYARPAEAAKHFGICKTTLWRWAKRPDFPKPSKVGAKITLFNVTAVANWLENQKEAVQ